MIIFILKKIAFKSKHMDVIKTMKFFKFISIKKRKKCNHINKKILHILLRI